MRNLIVAAIIAAFGIFLITNSHHTSPATAGPAAGQAPAATGGGPVTSHTGCLSSPHSCGFPDATNTGANCSSLASSGPITVSSGTVSGKNISGGITVTGTVTITNDCITNGGLYPIHFTGGGGGTIDHVTVVGDGSGCSRAVEPAGSGSVVMNHMNISGCEDGIETYGHDTLENSYIHDLAFFGGSHNDGTQNNGGSDDVISHNTILNPHNQTSCVNFNTDFGGVSNIQITGNLLDGGNYTVYVRDGGRGNGTPSGVSVTGNHFGPDAVYGLMSADGSVDWSGNVSDSTGRAVGS